LTDFKITKGEVRSIIDSTLGIERPEKKLDEAVVAQPKSFDVPTELLSEKAKSFHRGLYEGYIQTFNEVSAHLDTVNRREVNNGGSGFRSLKLDETYNLNALWLHELFFANMSDLHSEINHDSLAYMRLERDWGTFDDWQWDFMACAKAARSGWAVCGYHTFLQRYVNVFVDSHDGHVPMGVYPVIVIDMWEHSYVRDYLGHKDDYLVGQMKELDWDIIEARFERAERMAKALTAG
jgi:Fe-Mn family superoxide dismutase